MDYGRELQFGCFLTPSAAEREEVVCLAQLCDDLGLDLIGIQDHPYQARFLDTWTLLTYLAAQTSRVRFFPDVANLPLRLPSVLARAAASLDLLSKGRCELGLGAGAYWEGVWAMGGPKRSPGQAVTALEEAIQVIRKIWSGERGLRFEGETYNLRGAHGGPEPAHEIGIWIGAYGPRMLKLTGRLGDGWIPSSAYAAPEKLPAMQAKIDAAAQAAGREPASIQRLYNLMGWIGVSASGGDFNGPVEQWVDSLTDLVVEKGMDTFIFGPSEAWNEQIELFANEVAPRVRERVVEVRRERNH